MTVGCFIAGIFFVGMCGAEIREAFAWRFRGGRWFPHQLAGCALWASFSAVAFYAAFGS